MQVFLKKKGLLSNKFVMKMNIGLIMNRQKPKLASGVTITDTVFKVSVFLGSISVSTGLVYLLTRSAP
ncbi:hypothetical protein SAMN00790413_05504 [Deinococcus hopiensis KR-140]|uniref:Uncharacterized protein n=1 Tax=Deinococcus hopiensis KR-140 TaxID=695939 RepID=A0A1W1UHX1_9DEIO|nr:hypothetical protein SAMN00790413_05504 [Deinococcus hopiensis KR-140]